MRWQLAIDKYIKDRGYKIGTLVAFSGEVNDKESGPDGFTENSHDAEPQPERPRHPRGLQRRRVSDPARGEQIPDRASISRCSARHVCGQAAGGHPGRADALAPEPRPPRQGHDLRAGLRERHRGSPRRLQDLLHTTAELSATTDPNLVFNLRAKLDAAGHYDDFEVDRVVAVELNPNAKQSELVAALEPVVDRLMKRYKAAQEALKAAKEKKDDKAATKAAQDELNALILFKTDMGAFIRLYTFLSQIFDYGNTAIEKRAIFYKRLLPLLEFGREREGIDLSKVVLTHHNLKNLGKRAMPLERRRDAQAGADHRSGQRQRAGEGESLAERDHREGERPL